MSMNCWAEYGMGLVLFDEAIDMLLEKTGCEDVYDLVEAHDDSGHMWRYYDDEMDGKTFHSFDDRVHEEHKDMLVIWADHKMQPYKAAYSGPEELRAELQEAVGGKDMFPEDFDWDGHIGEFSTTIYC